MKTKILTSILVGVLVTCFVSTGFAAAANGNGTGLERVPVFIGFRQTPGPSERALVRAHGGAIKYSYTLVPAIAASIPEPAIQGLRRNPNVTIVEPDIEVYAVDAELENSWGVKRIGAGIVHDGGNKGAGVKVAIIDSGVDYTHSDLNDNFEPAGPDVYLGYDFVNVDNDPMDDNGHGTHVAGTVAAEDNNEGVVGVAPEASLYAYKVLDASGRGYFSDIIAAMQQCEIDGIQVANLSLGSSSDPGETVETAFGNADAAGIVIVAAAGNSGNRPGIGDRVIYPARYESCIAVAATDQSDSRASWSSTGPDVEISAPGVGINSTLLGGGYGYKSGTSMASPHVAGVVALMMSNGGYSRGTLQSTADDLGATGRDSLYGFGLVDAYEAAGTSAPPDDTTPPLAPTGLTASAGDSIVSLDWSGNIENDLAGYNVYRSITSGESYVQIASLVTVNYYDDSAVTNGTTYYYVVTAVDTSINESTYSNGAFATPQANGGGGTMHVSAYDMWYTSAGPNRFIYTKVTIVDSINDPISGATVYLEITLPDTSKASGPGDTGDDGTVTFKLKSQQTGTYTSIVTDVVKSGWFYDSSADVEDSELVVQ